MLIDRQAYLGEREKEDRSLVDRGRVSGKTT